MKSGLVDQFGRPMAYSFFDAGNTATRRERPFHFYQSARDSEELLSTASWQLMLSSSRFLFANVDIIRGVHLEQLSHSFPLEVQYVGDDADWAKIAEPWAWGWLDRANVKGPPFDNLADSRIRCLGYKVDGDIASLLTEGEDGFPARQFIRAHRIGNRTDCADGVVRKGPYKGKRIQNGVICNAWGRAIAYRVLGKTVEEDRDISASDMFLSYRPDYADVYRGIPHSVASIGSFANIKRLSEYEMRAQQIFASQTLIEKNATGTADPTEMILGDDGAAVTSPAGLIYQEYEAGMTRYYKSGSGSGLEAFRGDRPSGDAQAWEAKMVERALYSLEWDPFFSLATRELGGSLSRISLQKIHRCIGNNVRMEGKALLRELTFAIAKAIDMKALPMPKSGNWSEWEFDLGVPLPTADSGNEESAQREAYKLGLITLKEYCAARGKWWREHRVQRNAEAIDLLNRSKELQTLFPELGLMECFTILEQRNPNGTPAAAEAGDSGQETGDGKDSRGDAEAQRKEKGGK